jgi:hypothetical protein
MEKLTLQKELVKQVDILFKQQEKQAIEYKTEIKTTLIQQHTQKKEEYIKQKQALLIELKTRGIDSNNPEAKAYLEYFNTEINLSDRFLKGEPLQFENTNGSSISLTLDQIVDNQYRLIENQLISPIVEKSLLFYILEKNTATTEMLKRRKQAGGTLTTNEKIIDMLADVVGAGSYFSDKTFNTTVEISKELAIQVALMAISGGIANIAAKGAILAIKGIATTLEGAKYVTRVAKYANLSKTGVVAGLKVAPELFVADIIAEGAVFHLANTTLNAPLQGMSNDEFLQAINPFGTHTDEHGKEVSNAL